MSWGLVAVAAAGVVGGAMSASASKSAANKQSDAANRATDAQQAMFDQTVQLNKPYNQAGQQGLNVLSQYLGLTTPQQAQAQSTAATQVFDEQAYLNANPDVAAAVAYEASHGNHYSGKEHYERFGQSEGRQAFYTGGAQPVAAAPVAPVIPDKLFGSLLKPFGTEDFQLDPGIQFQTQQGNQALMNSQAAKNGTLSGGALKDLIAYNQGMAGTGYQSAFDRYMANKSFTLGSLMDVTKLGQAAASNTVNNAGSFSSGIAGSMMGAGNAQAAGTIGSANAISGGLQGAGNAYFLSSLLNKNGSSGGTPAGGVMSDDSIANFA